MPVPSQHQPSHCAPLRLRGPAQGARVARRRLLGITLVEIMTTLSVAIILMTTAVPGFYHMVRNNQVTVQANALVSVLTQARSEARKRRIATVMCKSTSGTECEDDAEWNQGWILFLDTDNDRNLDQDEIELANVPHPLGSNTLQSDVNFADYLAFLPDGRCIGSGSLEPPTAGTFSICDSRGAEHAREVLISPVGRATVKRDLGAQSCP